MTPEEALTDHSRAHAFRAGAMVSDAESGLTGFPERIDRPHLRDRLRGEGGADLIISDYDMAGVDRHMKQRRNIVMNLPLWSYSRKLMISRVSCRPKSTRTSMTVVFASDMRDVTRFMDPEIGTRTQYRSCRRGGDPNSHFGCPTGRSGPSHGSIAANACASGISSLTTASMRRTELVQKGDGQDLPLALAKIRFESMSNGPIHDPALRNAGVRFVGASSQSAPGWSRAMCRGSKRARCLEEERAWAGP